MLSTPTCANNSSRCRLLAPKKNKKKEHDVYSHTEKTCISMYLLAILHLLHTFISTQARAQTDKHHTCT